MKKQYNVSTKIYVPEHILAAIEDFSDVSSITFSKDILTIEGESEDDIQETFLEFMNYVLSY